MAAALKFMFDEDFAAGEKPTITMVEHERRRADAESQAHRSGFDAGQAQARTEASERVARALTSIADSMTRLDSKLADIEARLESEAVQVAFSVAQKLAPELIAREPFAEISALATECFRQLITTPTIGIHIGSDIYDTAKEKLSDIARSRGFEGRLTIDADARLAPGDCRIEWSEGGIVRDRAATMATVETAVTRYIAARTAPLN